MKYIAKPKKNQYPVAIEFQQLAQCATDTSRSRPVRCPGSLNFYSRFFKLALQSPSTPFLFSCLLHQEFNNIRRAALRGMQNSYYNLKPFPISDLVTLLGYDSEEEAVENLKYHAVRCEMREGVMVAMLGKQPRNGKVERQHFEGIATIIMCWVLTENHLLLQMNSPSASRGKYHF